MSTGARLLSTLAAAFVLAACGAERPSVAPTTQTNEHLVPSAAHERRAQLHASALLTKVELPVLAVRSATEPNGDDGMLRPVGNRVGNQADAVARAWWTVPGSPDGVLAYLDAHPPAGGTRFATGSVSDPRRRLSSQSIYYSWPAVTGVLSDRELTITVFGLAGGGTGVLAEGRSDWVALRPPGETVPGGVHEVDVTSAKLDGRTIRSLHVTGVPKVRALVSLIDAMPIAQPVAIACPALIGANARVIALRFRTVPGGPLLAQATYPDYGPDLKAPSGQCTPIEFRARGRREMPLIGGDFIERLQQLLGVNLLSG